MEGLKRQNGITLVALVITIIVLLILAGITIALVIGDNGILSKTQYAGEEYTKAAIKEKIELAIMDITAEEIEKQKNITMDIIVERLPDKVGNLTVEKNAEEASGVCDGYDYIITKDFEVIMGGKTSTGEGIKLITKKIGTASCDLEVKITSLGAEKKEYNYYVDGTKVNTASAGSMYTIEGLQPETEYTIYAIVIDVEGKQIQTNSIKIKTEPKTYLYNLGNESVEQTGGWDYYIASASGSIANKEDHVYYRYQRGEGIGTNQSYAQASMCTKNKVNLAGYKKIWIELENIQTSREMQLIISRNNIQGNRRGGMFIDAVKSNKLNSEVGKRTFSMEISDISEEFYIYYYSLTNLGYGSAYPEAKIYSIWLEK